MILSPERLGSKTLIEGVGKWDRFSVHLFPYKMPKMPAGHTIVCGIDHGEGEQMFICETPEHMQLFYHEYDTGAAVGISWYHTDLIKRPTK
jgi:hypothetical protein